MTRRRVVVTGLGATTPLGGDVSSTWEALLAGKSGVRKLEDEWAQDFINKSSKIYAGLKKAVNCVTSWARKDQTIDLDGKPLKRLGTKTSINDGSSTAQSSHE